MDERDKHIASNKLSEESSKESCHRTALNGSYDSFQKLEFLLDNSNTIVFSISPDFKRLYYISPNTKRILGIDADVFKSELSTWIKHVHTDDLERITTIIREELFIKGCCHREYRFVKDNGEILWVGDRLRLVKDETGNPIEIIGSWEEITDKVLARQSITESEEKYRKLFENSADGIFLLTDVFLDCNERATQMWNAPKEEIIGKTPADFSPEYQPDGVKSIDKAKEFVRRTLSGESLLFEWRHLLDKDRIMDVEVSLSSVNYHGSEVVMATMRDVTEKKKTELALRESEARNKIFVDLSSDAILMVDGNGVILDTNSVSSTMLGLPKAEIPGKNILSFIEHGNENSDAILLEILQQDMRYEKTFRKLSGETFVAEVVTKKIRFDEDEHFVVYIHDITEIREIFQKLQESETKFRRLAESAQDAICILNHEGLVTYWNTSAEKMFGVEYNEVIGIDIHKIIAPPDTREAYQKGFEHFIQHGDGPLVNSIREVDALKKDGTKLSVEISVAPIKAGEYYHAVGIMRDITLRKEQERIIKENEHRMKTLINALPDTLIRYKEDGTIIDYHHPYQVPLMGSIAQKEVQHLSEFYPTKVVTLLIDSFKVAFRNNTIEIVEFYIPYRGEPTYYEARIVPDIQNRDVISIVRDVTQEKVSQHKLKKYSEELKELNATKDRFFSIIAHDLRSPFTALVGLASYLEDDIDDMDNEEIRSISRNISKSSKNVYNLLENILQWTRIQTGRIDVKKGTVNLYKTATNIKELYSMTAANKKITIRLLIENSIQVMSDNNIIHTVLRNLVSNALKFTHPGGVVTISAEKTDSDVMVSVTDTGVGMSFEIQNKIFKVDQHVTTKGTHSEKGSGLGLVLCKEFVELLGGTIGVKSVPGDGSRFYFRIPLELQR